MLERERLESKKISKTNAVTSQLDHHLSNDQAHVGPSDYVPWLEDRKFCYIRMEGTTFGNVPLNCELKLEVWDSPNSAGVVIDAIRCAKLALDRGVGGALTGPSSYFMKSPPQQFTDSQARELVEAFIHNEPANYDRSHQALERTEQPLPLGLSHGSTVAEVFRDDQPRGNGDPADLSTLASRSGRNLAD
jgi:hypothetical protein